ncbi:hypothetical protein NL676_031086 [Syzygium grande]|nr:hypothetical protein NL676_031086 [Syzygium grande]
MIYYRVGKSEVYRAVVHRWKFRKLFFAGDSLLLLKPSLESCAPLASLSSKISLSVKVRKRKNKASDLIKDKVVEGTTRFPVEHRGEQERRSSEEEEERS